MVCAGCDELLRHSPPGPASRQPSAEPSDTTGGPLLTVREAEKILAAADPAHGREIHHEVRAALDGDTEALNILGMRFSAGEGLPKDQRAGPSLWARAAMRGSAIAITRLGYSYALGDGVPQDHITSVRLFQEAAELGSISAMEELGRAYRDGIGVESDQKLAADWYRQAAERRATESSVKSWCVLKVASDKEDQVRDTLERKVKAENLTDIIGRLMVPRERVKKVKAGKRQVAEKKIYPGYVFVEMQLNSDGTIPERAWYAFKETAGAGDFIGHKNKPDRMGAKEVEKLIADADGPDAGPAVKVEFLKGDAVKVREGPFENFEGVVDEIFPDKGMVRVVVAIFGRDTPLEMEYWQLEKP